MIEFGAGLVGFPEHRHFELVRWGDDDSPFSLLQSLDEAGVDFVVVPPDVFFSYEPEIDDDLVEQLSLSEPEDAIVLVIVTVGERAEESTANLLGPIVINRHSNRAVQAVLSPDEFDTRTPLVGAG